jgi:hypothetical protein
MFRPWLPEAMVIHTLIYSFPSAMTEQDRKQFFSELEALMLDEGHASAFELRPHLRLPADQHAPVFAATDVAQIAFPDLDAVGAASALPALNEFIGRWQARFPYQLVWANHEPAL